MALSVVYGSSSTALWRCQFQLMVTQGHFSLTLLTCSCHQHQDSPLLCLCVIRCCFHLALTTGKSIQYNDVKSHLLRDQFTPISTGHMISNHIVTQTWHVQVKHWNINFFCHWLYLGKRCFPKNMLSIFQRCTTKKKSPRYV